MRSPRRRSAGGVHRVPPVWFGRGRGRGASS